MPDPDQPTQSTQPNQPADAPFYMIYADLPASIRGFVLTVIFAVLGFSLGAAISAATTLRPGGDGTWNSGAGQEIVFAGTLYEHPYPVLIADETDAHAAGPHFLVRIGKTGAQPDVEGLDAKRVKVTGWLVERDNRRIIEIDPAASPIQPIAEPDAPPMPTESFGEQTLTGEIIDAKCYLGVMRPGLGYAHSACAALCIKGGIPPMLLVKRDNGNAYLLMTDEAGEPAGEWIQPHVGRPIQLTGELVRIGPLLTIRVNPERIDPAR